MDYPANLQLATPVTLGLALGLGNQHRGVQVAIVTLVFAATARAH